MTKRTAEQRLLNLKYLKKYSIEEAIEGYQLSLACCDHASALHFKSIYYDLLFDLFLKITVNITKPKYAKLFIQYQNDWEEAFCCYYKELYTAVIVVQIENISDYQVIEEILLKNYGSIDSLEKKGLLQYSVEELKKMLIEEIDEYKNRQTRSELYDIASSTNDINIAQKILHEMPPDLHDTSNNLDPIYENISLLQADVPESLRILEDVEQTYVSEETKYERAKKIYVDHWEEAKALVESIEQKYYYGLTAYMAAKVHNKEVIHSLISELDTERQERIIRRDDYDHSLFEIAYSIVGEYPYLAYDLMEKLHRNWGTVLDVQIDVTESLFKQGDKDAGLEYFKKIEEDVLKPYALTRVSSFLEDKEVLQTMLDHILEFEGNVTTYDSLYPLHKKLDIPFEVFYETTSKIMPYELNNYDPDAMLEMYEGYLVF